MRLSASAHNVANLLTEDFHPQRTVQQSLPDGGGSIARVETSEQTGVELTHEIVEQTLADLQARASLRAAEVQLDGLGTLLDLKS